MMLSDYANDGDDDDQDVDDDLEVVRGPTRVCHFMMDNADVYIGRDGPDGENTFANTPIGERGWLGNPYTLDEHDRDESVALFTEDLLDRVDDDAELRRALAEDVAGRKLGCWCRTLEDDEPLCHGDVIARVADALRGDS